MFKLKAKLRQVQLSTYYNSNLPKTLFSDRNRIKQIIINLLSNAFKFTQSGKITIILEQFKQNALRFGVKDEGIGISEEDQQKLFKAFSKVNSEESRKLNQQGVGLGLVISNQIAQNIGSTGLNIDSKMIRIIIIAIFILIYILMKISKENLKFQKVDEIISFKAIPSNIKEDLSTQQNCLHYLIVDDDCFNIFAFKRMLLELQKNKKHQFTSEFDIDSALSGSESITKIKTKKCSNTCQGYKIVFMDIEMPTMNGQQTTKIILQSFPNQIIIGCSGYTDQQEYEKCINSGMADFLVKPIRELQLIQILNKNQ